MNCFNVSNSVENITTMLVDGMTTRRALLQDIPLLEATVDALVAGTNDDSLSIDLVLIIEIHY